MENQNSNNPLHGIKLQNILEELVELLGWEEMAYRININCFAKDPSIKSSLNFLRKTPWARNKVEKLYLRKVLKLSPEEVVKKSHKVKEKPAKSPNIKNSDSLDPWANYRKK